MRLNQPYNLLRSGSLFCYRGIFSGLSNEPIGSASYNFTPSMDPAIHQLIATINTYQRLLQRYATHIVKNKLVASLIVQEVMNKYSQQVAVIPPTDIRSFLQENTQQCCQQWLATKSKTLYLRKPKNPT